MLLSESLGSYEEKLCTRHRKCADHYERKRAMMRQKETDDVNDLTKTAPPALTNTIMQKKVETIVLMRII